MVSRERQRAGVGKSGRPHSREGWAPNLGEMIFASLGSAYEMECTCGHDWNMYM